MSDRSGLPPPANEEDLDEDERKKRPDFEPFGGAGPPPPSSAVGDEPSPEALAEAKALFERATARAAQAATAAPPPAAAPAPVVEIAVEGDTLDRCLIYGIYQSGLAGLFKARNLGIKPEHLSSPENKFYALFEAFVPKTRLPTDVEIRVATGFELNVPKDKPYDVETFGEKIITRVLRAKLRDGLHPIIYTHLVKDPAAARDALGELVRDTAWSRGQASSYTDPATAQLVLDGYLKAKSKGGGLLGLSSPWPNVDKYSLGIQEGELTVILAKRKMGKSWILLKWMLHSYKNDLKPGESLLIISMEMPVALCWRRLAAIDLKLPYEAMRAGRLSVHEEARLYEWVETAKQIDPTKPTIHVLGPDSVRDVADIKAKTAELRPRGVAIDGLYILGRKSNMPIWERTIENISQIKLDLCAGMSVGVLATTQFKGSKAKSDLSVDADDAAYAKAIGDWADAMRGVVANSEMDGKKERLFVGMESREFRAKDILIKFDLDQMNFDEIRVVENSDEFNGAAPPGGKGKMTTPAPGSMPTIIAGTLAPNEPPPTAMDEPAIKQAPLPMPAPAPDPVPPPAPSLPVKPPSQPDPDMPRGMPDSSAEPF